MHELGVIPDRSLGGRGILAFQKIGDVLEGGAVTGGRPRDATDQVGASIGARLISGAFGNL